MVLSGTPAAPRRVVIRMTPFEPRLPYTAVADASFRTSMDWIVAGLKSSMPPASGTPSTTYSGPFPAAIDRMPRTVTFIGMPGR